MVLGRGVAPASYDFILDGRSDDAAVLDVDDPRVQQVLSGGGAGTGTGAGTGAGTGTTGIPQTTGIQQTTGTTAETTTHPPPYSHNPPMTPRPSSNAAPPPFSTARKPGARKITVSVAPAAVPATVKPIAVSAAPASARKRAPRATAAPSTALPADLDALLPSLQHNLDLTVAEFVDLLAREHAASFSAQLGAL